MEVAELQKAFNKSTGRLLLHCTNQEVQMIISGMALLAEQKGAGRKKATELYRWMYNNLSVF